MARYDAPSRRVGGPKQNTFFGGAAILAAGAIVVKLIGMFYKIPLNNIIGAQGNADFNNAYNIYAVLLTISTAGLPVAVSKLVSEANAQGRRNQVRRTFQIALSMFLILGTVSFLVMYFRADALAGLMNDTKAAAGIRALAPAVVCVGCLAALRGYSQGHLNMTPTSISQIIEAICKLFIGLSLAYAMIKMGQPPETAAAGAITGVTVGTMVALAYMVISFLINRALEPGRTRDVPDEAGTIIRDILRIAIPITLSSSMVGIVTVIDTSLVQGQVQKALLENPACWDLYRSFVDFAPLEETAAAWKELLAEGVPAAMATLAPQAEAAQKALSGGTALTALEEAALALHTTLEGISRTLYGNYSSSLTIYNLPTALMTAITISVIPTVSGALARRDRQGANQVAGSALRVTALLAFPMGVGLFVLGTPIIQLLFPKMESALAGPLLSTLGLATVFVCLMLVCNSILQAYGFVNLPILVMLLGGGVKIFANYNVVALPQVGIYGAPAGNILCFGLCLLLDLFLIARVIPRRPRYLEIFLKPLAASAVMGGAAWAVYGLSSRVLSSVPKGETEAVLSATGNAIAVLAAIGVAMAIYLVLVAALRAISRDDLALMPKGDKLAKLLRL
jgi:O-antigen/teichoic acid export membrane protein